MRVPIVSLCIAIFAVVSDASPTTTTYRQKCSTDACSEAAQQEAFKDFANIFLVENNIQKLFDEYIPGQYINHNPTALSGRQNAINVLVPFFATPGFSITPAAEFAGQGFGSLHYKLSFAGLNFAVMDRYRFQGTCIVEHWDVSQQIFGNETNPIAFF